MPTGSDGQMLSKVLVMMLWVSHWPLDLAVVTLTLPLAFEWNGIGGSSSIIYDLQGGWVLLWALHKY